MSDDDFYLKQDRAHQRAAQLKNARAKIDRGEPITKEERAEIMFDECVRIRSKIRDAMNAKRAKNDDAVRYTRGQHDALNEAVTLIITEMMATFSAVGDRRQALELRVLRLEEELSSLRRPASPSLPRLVSNQDGAGLRAGRAS
jgi:hypothetical protein